MPPRVWIVIALRRSRNYAFSSGTSIAAAHVSGLVALMLEKNPGLDLAGVRGFWRLLRRISARRALTRSLVRAA